jgi:hypothetical protein
MMFSGVLPEENVGDHPPFPLALFCVLIMARRTNSGP